MYACACVHVFLLYVCVYVCVRTYPILDVLRAVSHLPERGPALLLHVLDCYSCCRCILNQRRPPVCLLRQPQPRQACLHRMQACACNVSCQSSTCACMQACACNVSCQSSTCACMQALTWLACRLCCRRNRERQTQAALRLRKRRDIWRQTQSQWLRLCKRRDIWRQTQSEWL